MGLPARSCSSDSTHPAGVGMSSSLHSAMSMGFQITDSVVTFQPLRRNIGYHRNLAIGTTLPQDRHNHGNRRADKCDVRLFMLCRHCHCKLTRTTEMLKEPIGHGQKLLIQSSHPLPTQLRLLRTTPDTIVSQPRISACPGPNKPRPKSQQPRWRLEANWLVMTEIHVWERAAHPSLFQ